jgi:imidazolonepropionase-like amidohydrolase
MLRTIALAATLLATTAPVLAAPAKTAYSDGGPDAQPLARRDRWLPADEPTTDTVLRIPVPAGYLEPKGSFVLVGGRLFDGTGSAARPATVVVRGKSIVAVLKPGDRSWPADATVYDVTGKTVMPGLIDLHTHLTFLGPEDSLVYSRALTSGAESAMRGIQRMAIFLESGITTVRDVGSHGDSPFVLKRLQASGAIQGPRIFAAGQLITGTGGHGDLHAWTPNYPEVENGNVNSMVRIANGADQWREAVRIQFQKGADLIKLASEFSQAEVDAAVDEAHSLGLPVTVDAETKYIAMAVKAGVDSVEHPLPRTDETVAIMAKRHVFSVPTLYPYRMITRMSGGYFGNSSRRFELTEASIMEQARKLKAGGVKLGIGLDLISDWYSMLPGAYINELETFTELGYTKAEALSAATKTNAEVLHMSDRLGTIEPGKLADIIVVDGNPDEDFTALRRVKTAFVNGRLELQDGRLYRAPHTETPLPAPNKKGTQEAPAGLSRK